MVCGCADDNVVWRALSVVTLLSVASSISFREPPSSMADFQLDFETTSNLLIFSYLKYLLLQFLLIQLYSRESRPLMLRLGKLHSSAPGGLHCALCREQRSVHSAVQSAAVHKAESSAQ